MKRVAGLQLCSTAYPPSMLPACSTITFAPSTTPVSPRPACSTVRQLLVGQRIFVGGIVASAALTPDLISLRRQGVYGTVVPASVVVTSGSAGTFQLSNTALLGYDLSAPLKVNTVAGTVFFQGNSDPLTLAGLATASTSLSSSVGVVARGLVLQDPISKDPVLWAHRVREVEVLP